MIKIKLNKEEKDTRKLDNKETVAEKRRKSPLRRSTSFHRSNSSKPNDQPDYLRKVLTSLNKKLTQHIHDELNSPYNTNLFFQKQERN